MWHIWRNNNACGLKDTAIASYIDLNSRNYLPLVTLLQT